MDKEKAKEFIFIDNIEDKIYISKNLDSLIELNDGSLIGIYATVFIKNTP